MEIRESGENYLETILILKNRNGVVRSIDIANELEYSKPSVSNAMGKLKTSGYITMGKDGYIELTELGRQVAERIYERHCLLTEYLMALGVRKEVAAADACRIEHVISQESFDKMKDHVRLKQKN